MCYIKIIGGYRLTYILSVKMFVRLINIHIKKYKRI